MDDLTAKVQEILGSEEEVSTLVSAYDSNERNKMSGGWREK